MTSSGLFLLLLCWTVSGQIISWKPRSCLSSDSSLVGSTDNQIQLTSVYAQFDQGQARPGQEAQGFDYITRPPLRDNNGNIVTGTGSVVRAVLAGTTAAQSQGYSNQTTYLSTLVLETDVLTFQVNYNQSALCGSIRTDSATTGTTSNGSNVVSSSGCPYGPGNVALGVDVPLSSSYPLTSLLTRVTVLDPSVPPLQLACYDIDFTPYYPDHLVYKLVWGVVAAMLAAYFLLYVIARAWASHTDFSHDTETQLATSLTLKLSSTTTALSKRRRLGAIWFNAWAGKQIVNSGSLRRFTTPEFREIWGTVITWTLVGTVAVNWPNFAYPIFAQTSFAALVYNDTMSLPFVSPARSLLPANSTAPALFASQTRDTSSPLYLQPNLPPVLIDLNNEAVGIDRWAKAIGVRNEDVWSICAFTFMLICAGVVAAHLVFFVFDAIVDRIMPSRSSKSRIRQLARARIESGGVSKDEHFGKNKEGGSRASFAKTTSRSSIAADPAFDSSRRLSSAHSSGDMYRDETAIEDDDADGDEEEEVERQYRPEDDFSSAQLHWYLLQGNLLRALLTFHLPLTLFSAYEISLHKTAPTSSVVLAALMLVVVCFLVPLYSMWRIRRAPSHELYGSIAHLLAVGTLYNTYSDECTLFGGVKLVSNLVVGCVIGAAQSQGTAQAAVILLVEVADTLVTSLWLPWADNAAMGPIAFLASISRIVIAVLLIVLSPTVNVSMRAASWLAYIVLLMQGLVLILFIFVLLFKAAELVVRLVADVPFDSSKSSRSGGLFGALRKWDRRSGAARRHRRGKNGAAASAARRPRPLTQRQREIEERRRRTYSKQLLYDVHTPSRSGSTVNNTMTRLVSRPGAASIRSYYTTTSPDHASLSTRGGAYSTAGILPPGAGVDPVDESLIMSALKAPWTADELDGDGTEYNPTGYVKPGQYSSSSGPVLRSGPSLNEPKVVPAGAVSIPASLPSTSTKSGFSRVGGGRATYANPYELAAQQTSRSRTKVATTTSSGSSGINNNGSYPPYPTSSADVYNQSPPNYRRLSQSAVVEMANATAAEEAVSSSPKYQRQSVVAMPSSSFLLSNTYNNNTSNVAGTSPANDRATTEAARRQARRRSNSAGLRSSSSRDGRAAQQQQQQKAGTKGGFFGRFRRQRSRRDTISSDDFTDDDDDDEDDDDEEEADARARVQKRTVWSRLAAGLGKRGRRDEGDAEHDDDDEQDQDQGGEGERGFVVTRRPPPRLQLQQQKHEVSTMNDDEANVQSPSRAASIVFHEEVEHR